MSPASPPRPLPGRKAAGRPTAARPLRAFVAAVLGVSVATGGVLVLAPKTAAAPPLVAPDPTLSSVQKSGVSHDPGRVIRR